MNRGELTRQHFDEVREIVKKDIAVSMGYGPSGANNADVLDRFYNTVITPSYLRIDETLSDSQTSITFNILKSNPSIVEVTLSENDVFYMIFLGFFLLNQDDSEIGRGVLQTYPNETVFSTGGSSFDYKDLEILYNGRFSFQVGSTIFLENFDIHGCRYVPEAQAGQVFTYDVETSPDTAKTTPYSGQVPGQGFKEVTTIFQLSGKASNKIKLEYNANYSFKIAQDKAGETSKAVFYPKGYLVKDFFTIK